MSLGKEQAVFLTRRRNLPEPPIHEYHLAVIAEAVCLAWEKLPAAERAGDEASVNAAVVLRLDEALRERSLFSTLVAVVARGVEQHSYDGSSLEKRPDVNFYLTDRRRRFPLVAECKIIDKGRRKGIDKYRRHGVARFEGGEYAWGSSEGLMVAYVRDGSRGSTSVSKAAGTSALPWRWLDRTHHRSSHPRTFAYVDCAGTPGDVSIIHVWLDP